MTTGKCNTNKFRYCSTAWAYAQNLTFVYFLLESEFQEGHRVLQYIQNQPNSVPLLKLRLSQKTENDARLQEQCSRHDNKLGSCSTTLVRSSE
jgi:hypothetical protein